MDEDLLVRIQLAKAVGHVVLRDELAADLGDLELVRLAHIEQEEVVVVGFLLVEASLEFFD